MPNVDKLCFIGQNTYNAGRIAGDLMSKLLANNGKVSIVTGLSVIHAQNQRIKGFKEVIEERNSNIEIVDIIEGLEDDELSYIHTMELINSVDDLKGIYIVAGGIAGVGKAILEAEKKRADQSCML